MKIADALPQKFVDYMGRCEDQVIIKRFSGKKLLRIAGLKSNIKRQKELEHIIAKIA